MFFRKLTALWFLIVLMFLVETKPVEKNTHGLRKEEDWISDRRTDHIGYSFQPHSNPHHSDLSHWKPYSVKFRANSVLFNGELTLWQVVPALVQSIFPGNGQYYSWMTTACTHVSLTVSNISLYSKGPTNYRAYFYEIKSNTTNPAVVYNGRTTATKRGSKSLGWSWSVAHSSVSLSLESDSKVVIVKSSLPSVDFHIWGWFNTAQVPIIGNMVA
jgi:hypothetical protein